MRIAIVLPGHLRDFKKTQKSLFSNLINGYRNECDFFIWTWETLNGLCKCHICRSFKKEHLSPIKTEILLNDINKIYDPKKLVIESYNVKNSIITPWCNTAKLDSNVANGFFHNDLTEFCCMLYGWKKVKEMVEQYEKDNNFKYDLILRTRSDIVFDTPLNLKSFPNPQFYLPNIASYYNDGCNDQMAWGNNFAMKTYLSLYDKIPEYINTKVLVEPRPERLLKHHLTKTGIQITPINMNYFILRNEQVLYPNQWGGMNENGSINLIKHLI